MRQSLIRAVVFDFDGTLTVPGQIDFDAVRKEIGCPDEVSILDFIDSRTNSEESARAREVLERWEIEAAAASRPMPGVTDTVRGLRQMGLRVAILTRNHTRSVTRSLANFTDLSLSDFDVVTSRDDFKPPKPHPDSLHFVAGELRLDAGEVLLVGDYKYDIEVGNAAGAWTALLRPEGQLPAWAEEMSYNYLIHSLGELLPLLRWHMGLPEGKLPNDLLAEITLETAAGQDALLDPAVGEDVAAVPAGDGDVLVLKADPVTFATEHAGTYVVNINANDLATSGATGLWFLATVIVPPGTTAWTIREIIRETFAACTSRGIQLAGGHTEISDAVTRPVVSGMLAGKVRRDALLDKREMRAGDKILITGKPGIEGTAVIAAEKEPLLLRRGVDQDAISEAVSFVNRLSVVEAAEVAVRAGGVVGMHDVTEGGVATALRELAYAGSCRLRVEMEQLEPYAVTRKLCNALDIDPLGLIGSGSLLIACRPGAEGRIVAALRKHGVDVSVAGEATEKLSQTERGAAFRDDALVHAYRDGRAAGFPAFAVDEIARLFSG